MARYIRAKLIPPSTMKTTITHWVTSAKSSIERAFVEKPAVGIVDSAWANDWNGVISSSTPLSPSASRIANRTAVSAM